MWGGGVYIVPEVRTIFALTIFLIFSWVLNGPLTPLKHPSEGYPITNSWPHGCAPMNDSPKGSQNKMGKCSKVKLSFKGVSRA